MLLVALALAFVASYLIGGVPVGPLVSDRRGVDLSQAGSGRTGTTNVLRSVGRRAAALVLLGDVLKGVLGVLVARLIVYLLVPQAEQLRPFEWSVSVWTLSDLVGVTGSMAGHIWSIYLRLIRGRWHGGRGVATALGALLVVNPWVTVAAVAVGLPIIIATRYVSLGSILGALAGGVAVALLVVTGAMEPLSLLFLLVPAFIIASHRDNIARLLSGSERKLGDKARAS